MGCCYNVDVWEANTNQDSYILIRLNFTLSVRIFYITGSFYIKGCDKRVSPLLTLNVKSFYIKG